MAKYTSCVVFTGWDDLSDELTQKLLCYNIERVNANEKELSIIGKGCGQLWGKITLASGESLTDFEGVDALTKKVSHLIPIERAEELLEEAFGYAGEITVIGDNIYYVRNESLDGTVYESVSEIIEEAVELLDDESLGETVPYFEKILTILGNTTLLSELRTRHF